MPEGEGLSHTRLLQEEMLARVEDRLAQVPGAVELRVERSHLLAALGRRRRRRRRTMRRVKIRAPRYPITTRAYSVLPYTGKTLPITVLLLVAPEWGNAPFRKYLDDQTFLTLQVIADFHDPALALPPHQLVINCISDADACRASLEAACGSAGAAAKRAGDQCARATYSPLTASPNARRLGGDSRRAHAADRHVFPRTFFAGPQAGRRSRRTGFAFPLLLRAPGFHTGLHFVRVESAQELDAALAELPGDRISVIEFLDARSADGLIRKYRVMMIDGKLYPAHAAVSPDWKVHYFSAAMADVPEHRAEDREFLENMPRVLGPRAMEALRRIQDALKLDYAGVDFSLGRSGEDSPLRGQRHDEHQAAGRGRDVGLSPGARCSRSPTRCARCSSRGPSPRLRDRAGLCRHRSCANSPCGNSRHACGASRVSSISTSSARGCSSRWNATTRRRSIYLAILAKEPTQFVALNNLAALFNMTGHHNAALKISREIVALEARTI